MHKEIFKQRLKEIRKEKNWTQDDVAKETGISQTTLSKLENGKIEPSLDSLGVLAEFYEVSIDWLMGLGRKKS